jgi:hypothetical protein
MPRLTLPPATGTCRWLDDAPNGNRQLAINGVTYEVETLEFGWALYRLDSDAVVVRYEVKPEPYRPGVWTCTCPVSRNRPERYGCCKHVKALRAALAALPF